MIDAKGLWPERTPMRNAITALAAVGVLAAALPSPAQAYCNGCGVAAGVVGGLAAGAIIGGAIARPPVYVEPTPVYVAPPPPPAYAEPPDVTGSICHIERRQVWIEGYGYRPRRVEVCD